jgi:hypothetical protein
MQSPEKMVKKQNFNNMKNFNGDVEDEVEDLIDLGSPKQPPAGIIVEDLKQKKRGVLVAKGNGGGGSNDSDATSNQAGKTDESIVDDEPIAKKQD